jgi:hypothetical protein
MNTTQNQKSLGRSHAPKLLAQIGPETRRILDLAEQKGWDFNLLGQAPLPKEVIQLDQWLIAPANQDSSEMPVRTYKRIQVLFANGIRPKGFVVVHEAPRLLAAPKAVSQHIVPQVFPPASKKPKTGISPTVVVGTIVSSAVLGTILVAVGTAVVTAVGALFLGVALIDPIVVAVMEDGSWVEIDRWATKV